MKVVKGFVSALLSIIFIVSITLYIIFFSFSELVSEKSVSKIVDSIDINKIVEVNTMDKIVSNSDLSKETVDKILNNKELKDIVSGYISEVVKSVVIDGIIPDIDEAKLTNSFREGFDIIIKEAKTDKNFKMTDAEIAEARREMEDSIPLAITRLKENKDDINKIISMNVDENSDAKGLSFIFKIFRIVFNMRYIFLVVGIVCILFIVLLNAKEMKFIGTLSKLFISLAIETFVFGFGMKGAWQIISPEIEFRDIIETPINLLCNTNIKVGIAALIFGITLIIAKTLRKKSEVVNA